MDELERELYYIEVEMKMMEERWNALRYLSREEQKELGIMSYFENRDRLHMKIDLLKIKVQLRNQKEVPEISI